MATTEPAVPAVPAALAALSRADLAGLAALWPQPRPALTMSIAEPMQVLSLRHLPGGGLAALANQLQDLGLPPLPEPGRSAGTDPLLIWRSPNEHLLLTPNASTAAALLQALQPAPGALACAIDLSEGTLVVSLRGSGVNALMSRLVDAQAVPREPGQASRMRLADVAAVVWREAPEHVGLLVDRVNDQYLARWLGYAAEAV